MEVHPHIANPPARWAKKNFKEYFLEFIMIFLAVTLRFKTLVEINIDCKQNLITLFNKLSEIERIMLMYFG